LQCPRRCRNPGRSDPDPAPWTPPRHPGDRHLRVFASCWESQVAKICECEMGARYVAVNDRGLRIGEDHPQAKVSDTDVRLIQALHRDGMGYGSIAEKFELSKSQVRNIVKGIKRGQTATGHRRVHLP